MGFPPRLWRTPKRSLCHCPASPDARQAHAVFKVNTVLLAHILLVADPSGSPMRLLRSFPPLDALPVIGIAVTLVRDLPMDLYDELVRHPYAVEDH